MQLRPLPPEALQVYPAAQSLAFLQVVLQLLVVASQLNGAQSVKVTGAQTPFKHWEATMAPVAAEHVRAPQVVPSATTAQVPSPPLRPQELQAPQDATPQQNPSVQWPLAHSPSLVQAIPFGDALLQVLPAQ